MTGQCPLLNDGQALIKLKQMFLIGYNTGYLQIKCFRQIHVGNQYFLVELKLIKTEEFSWQRKE